MIFFCFPQCLTHNQVIERKIEVGVTRKIKKIADTDFCIVG